ncbi:MAG: DUF1549 domain-containing protein [Verrucomicrobiales bacterium]|nr:DUF1549 domain-containing protein [Verrucomicrobiales bacterium]
MKSNAALFFALGTILVSPLSFTSAANSGKDAFDVMKAARKIDALVEAGLKKNDLKPNAEISDETFLRRAYLDIVGRIPTIEEAEEFHGSTYDRKREQLIADLLESDGAVSHGYNFWADVLRINTELGSNAAEAEAAYQLWLKKTIAENRPYDQFVRELVGARGTIWDNGAIGYYMRDRGMPLDNMSNTVRVFLGTRLECAQCHDHPFDKWTQMDYFKMAAFSYGMAATDRVDNFPNRRAMLTYRNRQQSEVQKKAVPLKGFPEIRSQVVLDRYVNQPTYEKSLARLELTDKEFRVLAKKAIEARESYQHDSRAVEQADAALYNPLRFAHTVEREIDIKLPHDYQYDDAKPDDIVPASTMFGGDIDPENIDDSKIDAYTAWMTARDNPTFTKVIANRLWKRVYGHGVFEPLDDVTDHTPVANPELLAYIEEMMRTLDYDMRKYREVLYNTKSYQRAANGEELVLGMPYHFAGPTLRRMSAEQIWDSVVGLALPEADGYRPRLKSQLASIERVKKIHDVLAERSVEDYIAMVKKIAKEFEDLKPKQEALRVQMNAARDAGKKDLYQKLNKEYYDTRNRSDEIVAEIAYRNVGENVEGDDLLLAMGMSEMKMNGGTMSADATGKRAVLTQLPEPEMPEPPADLDSKQKNEWLRRQKKAYRNYTSLISEMARASELESPAPRGHFLREFGQSDREVIDNAADHASVPQALNLLNGTIAEALTNPFAVFGSRLHEAGDSEEKIELIFQAMLTREPSDRERKLALSKVEKYGDSAYERIVWALLNTRQFIFVQ